MIDALIYGFTPSAMIEKFCKAAAGKEVQQLQEAVLADDALERITVDAGHRDVCQHPDDDEHPQDEEDALADVRRAEGIDQGLEHGLLGRLVFVCGLGRVVLRPGVISFGLRRLVGGLRGLVGR